MVSKKSRRNTLILAIAIIVVGIAFLIAGIILLVKRNGSHCKAQYETSALHKRDVERCSYSEEAKRSGLAAFLRKVQDKAFDVQPFLIAHKPKVTGSEVQLKYKAYDPSPSKLQHVTDTAKSLLRELNDMIINENKLKSRERKALSQLRHFLRHIFGTPFDGNYYFGDYLLGPNVFCWQPICTVGISLGKTLPLFKPSDAQGLEILIEKLTEVNQTFKIYTDNLRYGVTAGMVRSVEECEAGLNSIQRYYFNISFSGPSGKFITYI